MTLTSFLTGIADKLRLYLGGGKIPAQSFVDKIDTVFEAGQSSMVDQSKIVENTVSGNPVYIDDASELPHDVTVRLSSKNIFPRLHSVTQDGVTVTVDNDGVIHLNGTCTSSFIVYVNKNIEKTGRYYLSDFATGIFPDSAYYRTVVYDSVNSVELGVRNNEDSDIIKTDTLIQGSVDFRIRINAGHTYDDCTLSPTLFYKEEPTEYVPYKDSVSGLSVTRYGANQTDNPKTYTANADGVVEGVKSLSPYMTFTAESGVNMDVTYHKSWGMQTEYDSFWNAYQLDREADDYNCAFAGRGWKKENFKPKYDIAGANMNQIFVNSAINGDLVEILAECGVELSFLNTAVTTLNYAFGSSKFTRIGALDFTKYTTLAYIFSDATYLKTIDEMKVNENTVFNGVFNNTKALENLKISGTIGKNGLNLQWSTKLSAESIKSVMNALSDTTSGLSVTLSLEAVNNAFETSEGATDGSSSTAWSNLVASKSNWTISLV